MIFFLWYFGNIIVFILIPLIKIKFVLNIKMVFYFIYLSISSFVFINIISFFKKRTMVTFLDGEIENTKNNTNIRKTHFVLSLIIYFLLLYFIIFKMDSLIR